jgi:endonuclease/exonuclease/phosphatase family metal-dependent hydrolase
MKSHFFNFTILVALTIVAFSGCNPETPAVAKKPSESSLAEKTQTEGTDSVATLEVAPDESMPSEEPVLPESQEPLPVEEKTPTPILEGPQDSETNELSAKNDTVNHNDPTSYPVTTLKPITANQIGFLSWNVESDGADGETIGPELTELNKGDRYDIITLTEVKPEYLKVFRLALGMHYKYAYSKSGRDDRMQILYNENKYEKVRHFELKEINIKNRYRAPLVVHLKHKQTETEFLVMVNHLARGKADLRQQQAAMLVDWARDQTLPIFALGDYNFDYVFETDKGNPAFVNFMRDGIYRWLKPVEMIDTNWYDNPQEPDGKDDYPGSMLDFAFVAGPAKNWNAVCTVIVREGDFPDNEKTSDHRPFEVVAEKK